MTRGGILIDDQDKHLTSLLRTNGILEFEWLALQPVTKLAAEIVRKKPSIVALDYRLDEAPEGLDADDVYKGSALAQHLRDGAIGEPTYDFPIVLVSTEDKLEKLYAPDKTAHDLFDRVYRKENLAPEKERIRGELVALTNGYERLAVRAGNFDPYDLLSADQETQELDFQELLLMFSKVEAPHLLSIYVLKQIIDKPGLLLDEDDAAARLGVTVGSFRDMIPALEGANLRYSGLYSDGWQRWWASRLMEWAEKLFEARPASLNARQRSLLLSEKLAINAEPARSTWNESDEELISFACCCCKKGAEVRHSLSVFAPNHPRFASHPRICWDCIQSDRHEHHKPEIIVDEADADLVAYVKSKDRAD